MNTKRISWLIAIAAAAAVLAYLAFGVFGIHTAFVDETVSEDNPFAVTTETVAAPEAETEAAAPEEAAPAALASAEPAEEEVAEAEAEPAEEVPAEEAPAPEPTATPVPEVPQIVTLASGTLVDHDHSGEGTANVITDGQRTFLRFEDDFAVDNGPDLDVYLVRGADAEGDPGLFDDDFINLGDLKGNIGAQNYELPEGIDITEYNTVAIWCTRFGVAFNAANLT